MDPVPRSPWGRVPLWRIDPARPVTSQRRKSTLLSNSSLPWQQAAHFLSTACGNRRITLPLFRARAEGA